MHHTLEKYKKAIKIKYEIEKEAEHFDFLYNPSRGKLRDLCWLIFENNPTKDDLNVFRNLFCLDFDHTKKISLRNKKTSSGLLKLSLKAKQIHQILMQ